jgi:hypothetical protein
MQVKMRTTGFSELKEAFKLMPEEVQNQVLAAGVIAGARVLETAGRAAAPRGGVSDRSTQSFLYGRLFTNIKARALRKRRNSSRAAIVTRGKAYWGDLLNRGTRYIPATHWWDNMLSSTENLALETMKQRMVKKMKTVADGVIRKAGAAKK